MATVIPAIRGRMGTTEFFETTMPAYELAASTRAASEREEWATATIEERIQRELNSKRVREQIVPYLRKSKDRFFGSIIVLVKDGDMEFEEISSFASKIPAAYRSVADRMGFLSISGGERIVLDGQHRLAALRAVVTGTYEHDEGEDYSSDVPNDEVCVIFIAFESAEKTRRIFNKVNRYAKTTSRADNIVTSEDDGYAIIARRLVEKDGPLSTTYNGELIVDWKSNTIAERSTRLTTISVLYETVKEILAAEGFGSMEERVTVTRPSDAELAAGYEAAERWWTKMLEGIPAMREGLADPSRLPALRKDPSTTLLVRPNGQQALVKGLAKAVQLGCQLEDAVERASRVDWSTEGELWTHVLVKAGGGMLARKESFDTGSDLLAYLIAGDLMDDKHRAAVRRDYWSMKDRQYRDADIDELPELPEPLAQLR